MRLIPFVQPRPLGSGSTWNHRSSRTPTALRLTLLLLVAYRLPLALGRIYIHNETYASLPGLFGKMMLDDQTYQGRVQFLHENPYLCDDPTTTDSNNGTKSSFVKPTGPTIKDAKGHNITLIEPVVLLASRGECPFQRKAQIAQQLDPSVEYLVVFNFNTDSEDTLVPMYSEFGDTRLILLSVTHRGGQAIKNYVENQPSEIRAIGGPMLLFDSIPPDGLISVDDLRDMLLSALGVFFMLISLSGCIMILAGMYGHFQMDGSRLVFTPHPIQAMGSRSNMSGLLTLEQARSFSETNHSASEATTTVKQDDTVNLVGMSSSSVETESDRLQDTAASSLSSSSSLSPSPPQGYDNSCCAICIDEFTLDDCHVATLPCQHRFHSDCIVPWLTERQAKCPLCKYDVLEYILRKQQQDEDEKASLSSSQSIWNRIRNPSSWSSLLRNRSSYEAMDPRQSQHHHHTSFAIAPEEMMIPDSSVLSLSLELSELSHYSHGPQRLQPQSLQ